MHLICDAGTSHSICFLLPHFYFHYIVYTQIFWLNSSSCLWKYVWTAATNRPTIHTPDDIRVWNPDGMIQRKAKKLGEKPVPVPPYAPQIPYEVTWSLAMRDQQLAARANIFTSIPLRNWPLKERCIVLRWEQNFHVGIVIISSHLFCWFIYYTY